MSPESVVLVRRSWERLAGREERVATRFYERLFQLAPDLEAMFVLTDMAALRDKLARTLAMMAGALDDPERWSERLSASARRHALYGVSSRAYRVGGEALLWALARELGDAFTGRVQAAWAEAYTATVDRMQREVRRQDATATAPRGARRQRGQDAATGSPSMR